MLIEGQPCSCNSTFFFIFLFLDHFFNKEWSILPTSGYPVRGGFGHSSVWDDITNRIYVYGGYVSTGTVTQNVPL